MSRLKSSESATVTRRGPALLALLAAVAMLVSLASCGVDGDNAAGGSDGDDTTTSTTEDDGDDGGGDDTTTTGDDGGDDTTSTTEDDGDDAGPSTTSGFDGSDESIRNALIQAFEGAGMTTDQATCLADGYIDMGITDPDAGDNLDIMAMMNLFSQCGVAMEDLGGLGGGLGAGLGS